MGSFKLRKNRKMDFDRIFEFILAHPQSYPGPHLDSQVRSHEAQKP